MRLGVCVQPFYDRPFERALEEIAVLGFEGFELPVDAKSPFVDLADLVEGGAEKLRRSVERAGLELTALSIHQEGQLLLGPHHEDTDGVLRGGPEEKAAYARERLLLAGRAAAALGLDTVVGFVGCGDWSRFFPWPAREGWRRELDALRERMLPILDAYGELGVRFAQEPHPKQVVYDTETALESVEVLGGHEAWGFNLDAGNLWLAGVDPVVFAAEVGARVLHVHAKDAEVVRHHAARSGRLAHGPWQRRDRGFRFRVPGWGDVDWKRLVSELALGGYQGWIAVEHEDPVFGRRDGLRKAVAHLRPLLPSEPREEPWW